MSAAPAYNSLLIEDQEFEENGTSSNQRRRTIRPDLQIRPPTYYGDGPFDPPSSDDEAEVLLEKNRGRASFMADQDTFGDSEPGNGLVVGQKRPAPLRWLVISLASLVLLSAAIGIIAATTLYNGKTYRAPGAQKISLEHVFNGTFWPEQNGLHWVPEAGDGVFSIMQDYQIKLVDLKTNTTTTLVSMTDVKDQSGKTVYWSDWKLSADMKYILVKANRVKQWRHSSFGNYYVHNLETKSTFPIIPPSYPPVTAYATWSPTGQSIAFVASNDLYVLPSPSESATAIRVTTAGNASLFHGVPDWIYEEEVFEDEYALWWSPDSSKLAFLRLDETAVDEYRFPIYNPTDDAFTVNPYTKDTVIKYPKPGYNNPLASIHIFDVSRYLSGGHSPGDTTYELNWEGRFPVDNSVIAEVAWVANETLIVKEVNRAADSGSVILFNGNGGRTATGVVVRKLGKDGEEGDEGWIDSHQSIYPIPESLLSGSSSAYLDIVPSKEGYNHIALFEPADSGTPRFLTSGTWEVTGGIQAVDAHRGLVYFQAARPSTERHLYSVPIALGDSFNSVEPTPLTDESTPSSYSTSFSPGSGFYLLNYKGPNVPWQKVIQVDNTDFDYVLTDNAALNTTLSLYETPVVTYSTIESDGFELNVKEMRPSRMDDSGRTKYAVLFFVYGGPVSQKVNVDYSRDWHEFLVCTLQYIVVIVDGRGTGFKGRTLRNPVRNNLGFWETQDQINAARIWAGKDYVDPKRIGIWGWSYGGFMASKVAEADAGIHSLAMAIAPVISWRLYDSVYTERYMGLPDDNPGGYINASISRVDGFRHVDYLLGHGSGDDNVHFANSAHMLDMLTQAGVRDFRFRMFTDSDHSISRRGGNREVYEYMASFLQEKWGKGGRRRGW
ncbi:dipeptidyl aminopeptidase [Hygrophoropsis aurantiaca]|uniref:Dipeptidyl aminopeptidase n=1 Tax=Hygrophoropsis aurantiaca TaxID=72124 RepID=A0ACB8ABG8_9AGAM|nr:dipeptidyl aminopeptidase [Hygrophoropsis aurantiaca]